MSDHRALIDQAKRDHVERLGWTWTSDGKQVDDPNQPHRCRLDNERWPCLLARLAEALEQAEAGAAALRGALGGSCHHVSYETHCPQCQEIKRAALATNAGIAFLARLAAAERERDAALTEVEQLKRLYEQCAAQRKDWHTRARTAERDLAAAQQAATAEAALHDLTRAERDELRGALIEFGQHIEGCPEERRSWEGPSECNCGFDAALTAPQEAGQ